MNIDLNKEAIACQARIDQADEVYVELFSDIQTFNDFGKLLAMLNEKPGRIAVVSGSTQEILIKLAVRSFQQFMAVIVERKIGWAAGKPRD
jgi:hypothetical protein